MLQLLSSDFFDEIAKKEQDELGTTFFSRKPLLVHTFGAQVGPLLYEHAHLEQAFKGSGGNVGPDGKMVPLDDEFLPEEAKRTAIKLRKTTANLVRHFQAPQLQIKVKALFGDPRQNEFAGLIDSFDQMKSLWWTKLTTPLEEVNSIKE